MGAFHERCGWLGLGFLKAHDLFIDLMTDEEVHIGRVDLVKRIGGEHYTQAHVGCLGEGGS
jgi:bacterioferritin